MLAWEMHDDQVALIQDGLVAFEDSADHFTNGFCRLLGLSTDAARGWIEAVVTAGHTKRGAAFGSLPFDEKVSILTAAPPLRPPSRREGHVNRESGPREFCGHRSDTVWVDTLEVDPDLSLVGCARCEHGWLIDRKHPSGEVGQTSYDGAYFEGNTAGVGYGDLGAQRAWRLEKATRMVRQIRKLADLHGADLGRVLDVGSGYGFFRRALADAGIAHEGLEVSRHAIEACRAALGFDTHALLLGAFADTKPMPFDAVTLWDVLEHVHSPVALLRDAARVVRAGGLIFLRTPSLNALERSVFGGFYHSLKREHLHVFSPRSVVAVCRSAGLVPVHLESESHLLRGFFGDDVTRFARLLEGSDLLLMARKTE
jgi:SAM-dependent methyltransferase